MVNKAKVGKQRKDKYYKLAKETGYRSRSSFKLLQLNRKFEFLQRSRVLVDLGAAPGGWLQVAHQSMPMSSVIIGVDLFPIKPIQNVITIEEDITTDKCKQTLKRQLKTWKADTILHDAAPNMGKNWLYDAFTQNQLTLKALKLATELLIKGGWFVTKVFRSKDYLSLVWVFKKLFKKVHATKPQASRNESAEIFVVCEGYLAPDVIDPKFLDTTYVFSDVPERSEHEVNILKDRKTKPKAIGYEEGDASVFKRLNVSDFVYGSNQLEKLSTCTEIVFNDDDIKNNSLTTDEIKECCKDIKVLGKGDLKMLLSWRDKLRKAARKAEKEMEEIAEAEPEVDPEEAEIADALKTAEGLEYTRLRQAKKKRKKILKQRQKRQEKMKLDMIIEDEAPIIEQDHSLFKLKRLKRIEDLEKIEEDSDLEFGEDDPIKEHDYLNNVFRSSYKKYNRDDPNILEEDDDKESVKSYFSDEEHESEKEMEFESDSEEFDFVEDEEKNPLIADVVPKPEKVDKTVRQWFDNDDFEVLDDGTELDLELLAEKLKVEKAQKGGEKSKSKKTSKKTGKKLKDDDGDDNEDDDGVDNKDDADAADDDDDEDKVQPRKWVKKRIVLDPVGLALGSLMVQSKKMKRDLIDNAYNKYAFNDDDAPQWLIDEERPHYFKHLPTTKEMIVEERKRLMEANARPIKKVLQAKARKARRAKKKIELARKQSEEILSSMDMCENEKNAKIKSLYKKALKRDKVPLKYVVAKKGIVKKRISGKGSFRLVDKRMRKDVRIATEPKQRRGRKITKAKPDRKAEV